jgi:hypothetical protein
MKMVSKVTLALLAAALALPVAGFADEQSAGATKPATAVKKNSHNNAPADCKDKKAAVAATAGEKRKQAHKDHGLSGERITHNMEAAHEHGRKDRD